MTVTETTGGCALRRCCRSVGADGIPVVAVDSQHLRRHPFTIGLRIGGRDGGDTVATVTPDGIDFVPGDVDNCPTTLDFDAASFVLTAEGRTNTGTITGDRSTAERLLGLFFRI